MAFEDIEKYISELIDDVKGLFGHGQARTLPSSQTARKPSRKVIPSPGSYTPPIHGDWRSSGGFTYQPNPTHPKGHMGVDMRVPAGTPVYPLAAGRVTYVGTDPAGGNVVNVQHADGVRTYYAHLSTANVYKGDEVDTDTPLGTVGNTGNAKGTFPHLHFQVWKNGQIQDPASYFEVPPYTNLSNEEQKMGTWISEQAKANAESFDMKNYLSAKRQAFASDVDRLLLITHAFSKITKTKVGV